MSQSYRKIFSTPVAAPAPPAPPAQTLPLLSELLGPGHARQFLATHWPERHYAAHQPAQQLPAVLRTPALASLDALARHYRGEVAFGRGAREARTVSADANAASLFRMGLSVYLPAIDTQVAGMTAWLRALERELGVPAGCATLGAFASPGGDGVACHFDADDVISIQLQGSKVFEVAKVAGLDYPYGQQFGPGMLPGDELYPQAPDGFPSPEQASFERIVMQPGSVLYLPRGTWHRTVAESDSFSVSIGMRPPSAMERLLQTARDLLLQDPAWRRPLYEAHAAAPARQALGEKVAGLLDGLPALLAQISSADLLQPPAPSLPLRPDSRLQKVPLARLAVAPVSPGRLRLSVTAWDQDWIERTTLDTEAPAQLAPALAWLAAREAAFAVQEFAEAMGSVAAADGRQLLELLVRAGYLRLLWYRPLASQAAAAARVA
ncbi:MAG: cupin domain-containing protein [Duganella sp.]